MSFLRGSYSRAFRHDLNAIVGYATSQALRLTRALADGEEVAFFDEGGERVVLPVERAKRMEPILVTLEEVAWLAEVQSDLHASGLIEDENLVPWAISWFDLESVLKLVEFPAQLTLYLRARRDVHSRTPRADEVELFIAYLERGLDVPETADLVLISGFSDEFDRHEMFGIGNLPRMPLSADARRRLERLDRDRPNGFLAEMERIVLGERNARRQ